MPESPQLARLKRLENGYHGRVTRIVGIKDVAQDAGVSVQPRNRAVGVPQVLHAWRSKRCDDLSWAMLLTFSAGVVLWLAYGLRLWAMPVIVANAVTLALLLIIMALKTRYASR